MKRRIYTKADKSRTRCCIDCLDSSYRFSYWHLRSANARSPHHNSIWSSPNAYVDNDGYLTVLVTKGGLNIAATCRI